MLTKTIITASIRAMTAARVVAAHPIKWPAAPMPVARLATLKTTEKYIPKSTPSYSIAALASLLALGYVATEVELSDEKKEPKIDARVGIGPAAASTFNNSPVTINHIEALRKMPQLLSSPPLSDHYVGRAGLQKEIAKRFSLASTQPLVVLKGLGGMGKTQLAAHYYQMAKTYAEKQWFNAESADVLRSQYLVYAQTKGFFELGMSPEAATHLAIRYLEDHPGWLLVYDNAENYDELKDLLPKKGGHILMTSRTPRWPESNVVEVSELTPEEARAMIRKISNTSEPDAKLDKLAETLGHLPLAIAQASAYIHKTRIDISEYLRRFKTQEAKLLADKSMPVGDVHDPVAITWYVNFEAVKKECPHAVIIQRACAYVDPSDIPDALLKLVLAYQTKSVDIDTDYDEAKNALLNYSLIKENPEKSSVSVHRLVQAVIRQEMSWEEKESLLKCWSDIFLKLLAEDEYKVIAKQAGLFVHFDRVLSHFKKLPLNNRLFLAALTKGAIIHCRIASEQSLLTAIDYCGQVLIISNKLLREEHLDVAITLNNLSEAYRGLGGEVNLRQAIGYLEAALTMEKKLLGKEHPGVATTLNNLGSAYRALGGAMNTKQAIDYLEAALAMRKKLLGEEDLDVATTLNNLGVAYCGLGGAANLRQAIGYYEAALAMRKKLLGEEHPDLASTLNNLGAAYHDLGGEANLRRAIGYYEAASAMGRKLLGEDHPYVAITQFNLSVLYLNTNDLTRAKSLALQAHSTFKKQLRADHPYVLETEAFLSKLQKHQLALSSSKAKSTLAMSKKLLGEEHPDVVDTLNNLGVAYCGLGGAANFRQAIGYFEIALAMNKKLLGEEHPAVAQTLNNLGVAYCGLGGAANLRQAIGYYEAALAMRKRLGEEHPDVASTLNNLGAAYRGLGGETNLRQAIGYYEAALAMGKKLLGAEHLDVATTQYNLSLFYLKTNDLTKAEPLALQAHNTFKKQLRADHPDVLKTEALLSELQKRQLTLSRSKTESTKTDSTSGFFAAVTGLFSRANTKVEESKAVPSSRKDIEKPTEPSKAPSNNSKLS